MDKSKRAGFGSIDGFIRPASNGKVIRSAPLNRKIILTSRNPKQTSSPLVQTSNMAKKIQPLPQPPLPEPKPEPVAVQPPETLKSQPDVKQPARPKAKKHWSRKRKILTPVLGFVLVVFGVLFYFGWGIVGNIDKVFHGNIFSDAQALFSSNVTLNGEANGRINILLAGDSADDPGHQGAQLTDSILVLSIDTKNHTAFMLSIPRDLWVLIPGKTWPGGTWQKINAANEDTGFNMAGYPSNGMGALWYIVQNDLGIPIDYYALMDYGAFEQSVNAVGGVTINIQSTDPRGLYDPNVHLKLPNGLVTLNGQQALNLARARGDGYGSYGFPSSDFDRTEHQRQLFTAIAEKAKSLGVISNPIKVSDLFNAFGNNVQTDISLPDVLSFISLTKGINPSTAQSFAYCATLTSSCPRPILIGYIDPGSQQDALIPTAGMGDYSQMQAYYNQLTSNNLIVKEDAAVTILNGSGVTGLAKTEENDLIAKGVSNVKIADASTNYPSTLIVNLSNGTDPNTLQLLQKMFPGSTVTSASASAEAGEAQNYTSNFVVILGQNWASPSPG